MKQKTYIPVFKEVSKWKRPKPSEKLDWFVSDITENDIKKANLTDLENLLKVYKNNLDILENKKNPYVDKKGIFGGPAYQWSSKHYDNIQNCKRQIDIIQVKIKELKAKER